jgi:hypothetical protein
VVVRRVDHQAVPEIDADVAAPPAEEHQVTGFEPAEQDPAAAVELRAGEVRQADAERGVGVEREARAVEPDPATAPADAAGRA